MAKMFKILIIMGLTLLSVFSTVGATAINNVPIEDPDPEPIDSGVYITSIAVSPSSILTGNQATVTWRVCTFGVVTGSIITKVYTKAPSASYVYRTEVSNVGDKSYTCTFSGAGTHSFKLALYWCGVLVSEDYRSVTVVSPSISWLVTPSASNHYVVDYMSFQVHLSSGWPSSTTSSVSVQAPGSSYALVGSVSGNVDFAVSYLPYTVGTYSVIVTTSAPGLSSQITNSFSVMSPISGVTYSSGFYVNELYSISWTIASDYDPACKSYYGYLAPTGFVAFADKTGTGTGSWFMIPSNIGSVQLGVKVVNHNNVYYQTQPSYFYAAFTDSDTSPDGSFTSSYGSSSYNNDGYLKMAVYSSDSHASSVSGTFTSKTFQISASGLHSIFFETKANGWVDYSHYNFEGYGSLLVALYKDNTYYASLAPCYRFYEQTFYENPFWPWNSYSITNEVHSFTSSIALSPGNYQIVIYSLLCASQTTPFGHSTVDFYTSSRSVQITACSISS
jgi:hypothetical protein